ncbi:MAG: rubredoxin [Magnetococcales bacterium]|nr:rubredoxin [Magnetococcales bacterium]
MADRWVCLVCDYVYDSEAGDPEGGIMPGTLFKDLPESWCCPYCGAKAKSFAQADE